MVCMTVGVDLELLVIVPQTARCAVSHGTSPMALHDGLRPVARIGGTQREGPLPTDEAHSDVNRSMAFHVGMRRIEQFVGRRDGGRYGLLRAHSNVTCSHLAKTSVAERIVPDLEIPFFRRARANSPCHTAVSDSRMGVRGGRHYVDSRCHGYWVRA